MQANQEYIQLLQDIKSQIARSRYVAARLVNREQLMLYYKIGRLLDEKIIAHQWGDKVIKQLAEDLKNQQPAVLGFGYSNLKNMRQFYCTYAKESIGQSLTAQMHTVDDQLLTIGQLLTGQIEKPTSTIGPSTTAQLPGEVQIFLSVSFTHHLLLLNKCKSFDERIFYMVKASSERWSVSVLEHCIKENLFHQMGKLHHNFDTALRRCRRGCE